MSALKDELLSILPKSSNTKTSLSKMDRVFMIILLLNLGPDFENLREQILTGAIIPNFDRWYQLHGRPPRTSHLAQSSNHSTSSSSVSGSSSTTPGVILTPGEYEYLRLTQAIKSSFITFVAQTDNVSTCLTLLP